MLLCIFSLRLAALKQEHKLALDLSWQLSTQSALATVSGRIIIPTKLSWTWTVIFVNVNNVYKKFLQIASRTASVWTWFETRPKSLKVNYLKLYCFNSTRSYTADLKHKVFFLFHDCQVALTSHICYPIRLVFHQHLNSQIAYPGIPPEPSNHTRGQFLHLPSYPLLRLLWSKSDNKVTRKRILDQYHTGTSLSSTALR